MTNYLLPDIKNALEAGEIVSILAPISVISEKLGDSLLNDEEKSRLGCLKGESDKLRYRAAHTLKRIALASVIEQPHDQLTFLTGVQGKPYCTHPLTPYFNLSHTRGWVVLALSFSGEVGVDLEFPRECNQEAIIKKLGSLVDIENYQIVDDPQEGFLCFWTQKEALSKAIGGGLLTRSKALSVSSQLGHFSASFEQQYYEYLTRRWNDGILTVVGKSSAPWGFFEVEDIVENGQHLSLMGNHA